MSDESAGMLDQVAQDRKGLGHERDARLSPPQALVCDVETEPLERSHVELGSLSSNHFNTLEENAGPASLMRECLSPIGSDSADLPGSTEIEREVQRDFHGRVSRREYLPRVMRSAFVLRLGPGTQPARQHYEGWIEEIDTARELRFRTTQELLSFLGDCVDITRQRERERQHSADEDG